MGYLEHQLSEMKAFLTREEKRHRIAFEKAPEGTLQRMLVNDSMAYVHSIPDPSTPRKYSRRVIRHDPELIRSLAAKEYAMRALKLIERNLYYLDRLENNIKDVDADRITSSMKNAYRSLPTGCFLQDQVRDDGRNMLMQRQWASESYEMSDNKPESKNKSTSRGLFVRSKSEVLLAEKLYEYEIPFRYEQVFVIGNYTLAPDFTFLDRNGNEFYLEYCGMMDDPDYVAHYMWKRNMYERAGVNAWDRMIYVYEENNEIHLDRIDNIIRTQILSRL